MGQIVRRKKKGRPSKADLARRKGNSPAAASPDVRRSLRRRNVRYNVIDYDDDYLVDEEDERRREKKKLKLVTKLNHGNNGDDEEEGKEPEEEEEEVEEEEEEQDQSARNHTRAVSRGRHAPEEEEEEDREIDGEENEDEDAEDEGNDEVKGRKKVDSKGLHSVSGTPPPNPPPSGIPLPDKKTLELTLDKLQKKDTYGVFAEPVDPEELPDYHDVIEHPMDFATVRNKLSSGAYLTLEQFERDVFLICSNAMQYNAPETVYHKQARSMQELGRKKFEKLRVAFQRSQIELKSEQKSRSNSLVKKQAKKPFGHASQDPVSSDFSSVATLATVGDVQPTFNPLQGVSCERPSNFDGSVEGNAFMFDANQEKAEDILSGRGLFSKLGRKSFMLDESRRATYNMSNQPITRSESIIMTFESEMKQLVTVGLHAEYSYARSLARFSATLGPIAWKIASNRIQKALPAGCKFGHGWVGEYEPLPTPVKVDNGVQKEIGLVMKLHSNTERKVDKICKNVEPASENPVKGQMFGGTQPSTCPANGLTSEGKPSLFDSTGVKPSVPVSLPNQKQNVQSKKFGKSESKGLQQMELNRLSSSNQNNSSLVAKFISNAPTANSPAAVSKPGEMVPRNMNALPSIPFKQPDSNGVVSGELPNGKVIDSSLNRWVTGPSSEGTSSTQTGRSAPFVVHGQENILNDPVQLMRMYVEKSQKQQTSNHSPIGTPPVTPSGSSGQRDDSGNASAAAARAWMSVAAGGFKQGSDNSSSPKDQISADSLHNSTREFHQHISRIRGEFPSGGGGTSFQSDRNNFPFQAHVPQPIPTSAVAQFPNGPIVFPQLASADLPRFQTQSSWRGLSPRGQQRQQQEALPPDLNIGFQSPGSPAKQSSGVLADNTQQPDLALQL